MARLGAHRWLADPHWHLQKVPSTYGSNECTHVVESKNISPQDIDTSRWRETQLVLGENQLGKMAKMFRVDLASVDF